MRRLHTFKGIVITCFLIIALPSLFFINFLGRSLQSDFEQELNRSNRTRLETVSELYRQVSDNFITECVRLTGDDSLERISKLRTYRQLHENADNAILVLGFLDKLANIANTNEIIHSIYIYLGDTDYLLYSNMGVCTLDRFQDSGWMQDYLTFAERAEKARWFSRIAAVAGADQRVITAFWRMSYYAPHRSGGIIININEDALCRMLNPAGLQPDSTTFILDEEGLVVSHPDKDKIGLPFENGALLERLERDPSVSGYLTEGQGRERTHLSFYRDPENGWIIVNDTSIGFLRDRMRTMNLLTIGASVLLLVSLIPAWLITERRLYNPVRQIMRNIKAHRGVDLAAVHTENELILVKNAFLSLVRQEESLFGKPARKRSEAILALIGGDDTSREELGCPPGQEIRCVLLSIDRQTEFNNQYPENQRQYICLMILEIAEQLFGPGFGGAPLDDHQAALLLWGEQTPDIPALEIQIRRIQGQLSGISNVTLSAGVSDGCANFEQAYLHAVAALEAQYFSGGGQIHVYPGERPQVHCAYPLEEEKALLQRIAAQDASGIGPAVDAFIEALDKQPGITRESAEQSVIKLAGNLTGRLLQAGFSLTRIYGRQGGLYQELLACETLRQVRDVLDWAFSTAAYSIRKQGKNPANIDRIRAYIERNYHRDIDIHAVAEHIGLSYSYVRKLFQDHMNVSISDYLHSLRIGEAKHLLETTQLTSKQIAMRVGYNCEQSFNRVFKRLENQTPGLYRAVRGPARTRQAYGEPCWEDLGK